MAADVRRIEVPGGTLVAEAEGEGPPILLVHSALVNRRSWDALAPLLLAGGYRVLRHDMRGFGESTTEDVEFSPVDDIVAVLDAFRVGRAAIGGNSMGAIWSVDAALSVPERFVTLVWIGGGVSGFEIEDDTPEEVAAFEAMRAANRAGDADAEADWDVRMWVDGVGQPATRVPREIREAVRRMDRELVEPGRMFGTPRRLQPPANERLADLRLPTLAVIGGLDTKQTRDSATRLATGAPNVRLVTFPDVAHMVGMEAPERLAAVMLEHLDALPRWS